MNKWIKFVLLYLGGVLIALSQLKVTPIIIPLSQILDVSLTQISWLTSIFTVSGIFIAIPGGMLVTRLGAKKLLLIITSLLVVGNFLGVMATHFYFLLFSRMVEGIAFSTIIMIAVVLLSFWFKESTHKGTAIGIFTTFPATGTLIAMNYFVPLSEKYGYFSSWYLVGFLAIILLILYYFFIDAPDLKKDEQVTTTSPTLFDVIKNKAIWLLAIMQGCMAFVLYTYVAIYPLIFINYYSLDITTANFYASLFGLFGIPFGIVAGLLIDKTQKPGLILFISFSLMCVACLMVSSLTQATFILQVFMLSVAASLASCTITIMVPREVTKDELIGYSMSFVNLFYYLCIVIGAPLITKQIESYSWQSGFLTLLLIAFVGVIAAVFYIALHKKHIVRH